MAGALFNRLKVWKQNETVTQPQLNGEIDNIMTHLSAPNLTGYSADVPQMQTTRNPGGVGTESLASSVSEEIGSIRFQLDSIIGADQWYEAPPTDLTQTASNLNALTYLPQNRILSGLVDANQQPMFLVANGAAATVSLKAAITPFVAYMQGIRVTFNADITATGLQLAPATGNTATVGDPTLTNQPGSELQGEGKTYLYVGSVGGSIGGLGATIMGLKVVSGVNSEYFIAEYDSSRPSFHNGVRGYFFNSSSGAVPRISIKNTDTVTLLKLTWVFATYNSATPALDVTYSRPTVSYVAPVAPNGGDYWLDITVNIWKRWSGSTWINQMAVFAGVCVQDTTNCIASRSADFYRGYSSTNTFELEKYSLNTVRSRVLTSRVSVYGTQFQWDNDFVEWNGLVDLDSGVSLTASTTYYCYITSLGKPVLSDVAPHDRTRDLLGRYHTHKPWRCVGEIFNNASNAFQSFSSVAEVKVVDPIHQSANFGLSTSVATNALTINLIAADGGNLSSFNYGRIAYKKYPLTDSAYYMREIANSLSIVVPASATLGHTSGNDEYVYVWAIDNEGHIELGVSGSMIFLPYGITGSTTAITSGATSRTLIYASEALSNVPIKLIGKLKSNQAAAGTWAADTTNKIIQPLRLCDGTSFTWKANAASNHGSTNTCIRRISQATTTYTDGVDNILTWTDSATLGSSITILKDGVYSMVYYDSSSGGNSNNGISLNTTHPTTSILTVALSFPAEALVVTGCTGGWAGAASITYRLSVGDVIRPHDVTQCDWNGVAFKMCRLFD